MNSMSQTAPSVSASDRTAGNFVLFDRGLRPILKALAVATLPHVLRLPVWITLWCFAGWAYVWHAGERGWPFPKKRYLRPVTIFGIVAGLVTFGGEIYSDSWVALLAVMAGLKPMECRSYRDRMITLFLAYFMVITNLFYADNLGMTLYMFLSVLVTTAVLVHLHAPGREARDLFRVAGAIMVQAIPLMVILFFLFPRLQGTLFGFTRSSIGTTGFTDAISPGSVSRIVQNEATAFRVQFQGPIPPASERYWRGITFPIYDAGSWRRGPTLPRQEPIEVRGPALDYAILMEPHNDQWLFALEMPVEIPDGSVLLDDLTILSRRKVRERDRFELRSYTDYRTGAFQRWENVTLRLPEGGNPEARALARRWADTALGPQDVVDAAMAYFEAEEFVYTLRPPLLGADPIDQFLFETRQGFCEHYASAFVYLMRAAGIPARVVGGYQGGYVNPYGDYLIVSQSDAHAWAEVWMEGSGWLRVDPTTAVAPERAEQGVESALSPDERFFLSRFPGMRFIIRFLRPALMGWDWLNTNWTVWVLGYTFERQTSLLARLGIRTDDWRWMLQTVSMAVVLVLGLTLLIALRMYRRTAEEVDAARQLHDRFCAKVSKIGIRRKPHQGPVDFAAEVARKRPDLAPEVSKITDIYVKLRYSRRNGADQYHLDRRLREMVRKFRPKPLKPGA